MTRLLCDDCRTPEKLGALLRSYADPTSLSFSGDGHSAFIAFGSADVLENLPNLAGQIASNPTLSGWWNYWFSWISTTPENAEFLEYLRGILPHCPELSTVSPKPEPANPALTGQIAETLLTISNGIISQVSEETGKKAQKLFRQGIARGKGAVSEIAQEGAKNIGKQADVLIGGFERKAKKSAGGFLRYVGNALGQIVSRILHSVIFKVWLFLILPIIGVVIGLMLLAYFLFK